MNLIAVIALGFLTIFIAVVYYAILCGYYEFLFDLLFKTFATIVGIGLSVKGFFIFLHWCISNNYGVDYDTGNDLFHGSQFVSKNDFEDIVKKFSESPTPQKDVPTSPTPSFDFTIKEVVSDRGGVKKSYPPGSQAAIDAYNNSNEKKALDDYRKKIDLQIEKEMARIDSGI